jgi:hypothetical protein
MDGSEAVDPGRLLSRAEAEKWRRAGQDVVVCGPDPFANVQLARQIEAAASPGRAKPLHHGSHLGLNSLPHWQQRIPPPEGHTFYETPARRARVKP